MLKIVRYSEFKTTPWKNGGGITREALRQDAPGDPSGSTFLWRLSVAQVDASGPFSDFAGYRRTLVLLQGDGVRLSFSDRTVTELRAVGDLVTFDGALAAECKLLDGPCMDLNLMASESVSVIAAGVEVVAADVDVHDPEATTIIVFCIDGAVTLAAGDAPAAVLAKWDVAAVSRRGAEQPQAAGGVRIAARESGAAARVFIARLVD